MYLVSKIPFDKRMLHFSDSAAKRRILAVFQCFVGLFI